ncbi:TPA: ead/Ea22-like family protein [Citrobacter sedlakii]
MSNIDKQALREVAVKATALNLDTAQLKRRENESCECPVCFGEGYVDVESDYCNIDGVALGVLFYGIGEHHGLAETFFRAANPATVLALLDELEAKDSTISTQQQEIRTLLNALEQATEKRNYDIPGHKRLIGWRASDYTDETSDPELAKNWAAAIGVLPIFEGDVNTKLSAAGIGKGE